MKRTYTGRYDFVGLNGCASWCNLEVWQAEPGETRPPIVLAIGPADAPDAILDTGTSVTNAAETLATQVCRDFELEPRALVWVECYEEWRYAPGRIELVRRDWDQVFFRVDARGGLHDPDWRHLGRAAVEGMIGHTLE